MGCPDIYYKKVLQAFCYDLAYDTNEEDANKLYREQNNEKLENFILEKKNSMKEQQFYYEAGMTTQSLLCAANEDGIDAFNACLGGVFQFECLIGVEVEEE